MKPEDIRNLLARLEALEKPSREVDLLLDCLTNDRRPWNVHLTVPAHEADYYERPDSEYSDIAREGLPLMRADHPRGEWMIGPNGRSVHKNPNRKLPAFYTSSLDDARRLLHQALPGWSYRVMECCVSDDAWVQPDFNCPIHGARLRQELNRNVDWVDLTDVDHRPSGNPAIALCIAILLGLQLKISGQYSA